MAVADSRIAKSPIPADALEKYPGQWIAVRDGHVVADAESLEELVADSRVEALDALYHVPPPGSHFY